MEFYIKHKITAADGTNKFYAGMHWSKRKNWADYWHRLVKTSINSIPRHTFNKPVFIEMWFESGLDIDGHSIIAKTIIDALVQCGWLVNDNKNHVQGLCLRFKNDLDFNGNSILVKIREVE